MAKKISAENAPHVVVNTQIDQDEIVEYISDFFSNEEIVNFIIKLDGVCQDADVKKALYQHFHEQIMRMV